MNKIFFVVPVYKVEKYLARCVESILAQTYENTEIVLVEGMSKKDSSILTGYTESNKLVNFKGDYTHVGKIVNVKITEATTYYLKGEEIDE
jgi:glycosyltransferase involved in cell wall biosynthesis